MRVPFPARFVATLAALFLGACDGSTGNDGTFSMSLSAATATVAQGSAVTITLTFTRVDFTGPITLAAEGLPTGVTATFSPNPASAGTSIMQLTAAAGAAPGSATVTIRATADGPAEQTATLGVDVGIAGTYTLGALNPTLTVAQGGGDRTSVLVNRSGGFSGSVAVALSGAPAGLTATLGASSTTGNSLSLSVAASGSIAVGTYTLTATGTSTGVADQQTTVTINVVAAPATASLTMTFCATSIPTFVGYKNEGADWQAATAAGNSFTFNATDRVAVVTVFTSTNGAVKQTNITYATRAEFANFVGRDCPGTKTITGSVAGLNAAQQARVALGPSAIANPATANAPNFALTSVPDRTMDLVGTMGVANNSLFIPDKVIIRRDINPAPNAVLPTLDFAAVEAFAPQQNTLTIGTANATDPKSVALTFWSANNTFASLQTIDVSQSTVTIYGVPQARQVAGDLHELYLDQFVQQSQTGRSLLSYYATPVDRTESVGPFVNTPIVTTLTAAPYLRYRARVDAQTEYPGAVRIGYRQVPSASDDRTVFLQVTASYLGATPAQWDLVIPDMTGAAGFNNSWMLLSGQQTGSLIVAYGGRTELLSDARPAAGDILRFSDRSTILTGSALRAEGPAQPMLPRPQYFRR